MGSDGAVTTVSEIALADICQHPEDEAPRLIYADWLKEHDAWTWDIVQSHVLHHPQADGPRLLAADWLDEHSDPKRSEFIRVQCELARIDEAWRDAGESQAPDCFLKVDRLRRRERKLLEMPGLHGRALYWDWLPSIFQEPWFLGRPMDTANVFRRGFVGEVTLTTEDFLGGPCGVMESERVVAAGRPFTHFPNCGDCRGTGRTKGHARDLFRAAPLLRVTLSDKEPSDALRPGQWWWWWAENEAHLNQLTTCDLPQCLWDLLSNGGKPPHTLGRRYNSRNSALDDLSAAALLWGRRQGWPCPRCIGQGTVHEMMAGRGRVHDCSACHGTGYTVTT